MNQIIYPILIFALFISSCVNQVDQTRNTESTKEQESTQGSKDDCQCSSNDVNRLANQVIQEFTQTQNELPSEMAKVIRKESVDKGDDCSWVVTFKISWPFGNTDGAHPDEFLRKSVSCNGTEAYMSN